MSDLSLFLDDPDARDDNLRDTYYILALVLHDQADALADNIVRYELALRDKGLPDVPFHATPLLNGHDAYEGMDLAERKRLLSAFRVFFRHLPVRYGLVVLRTREYSTLADVEAAMRRKIADFLFDKLAYFQVFDSVKIYYDDGQQSIAAALRKAIDYALSKNAVTYRPASAADTALVNSYLRRPEIAAIFPPEFRPMWSVNPSSYVQGDNVYELVAIRAASRDGKAPLDGSVVTDARVEYNNNQGGEPSVSMTMNAEGANVWARLTRDNIGRQIAIVLDGTVYSYPNVQGEITGGSSSITGNFSIEEATDLTNVLKSGKLPAPATIVQEQVVGPSLGAESIKSGFISFLIAFFLVLFYMVFFYKGAGLVADAALLTNVVLLLGTLSAFGAVLTLPGIAGLVLTMGMAVDANVIIYERIKEEIKAGKGIGKAVADGYSNAYSAIIDGQVTTLLTGIVLFFFGSGPIKGFATTLIIGIITSVLTSIFISRLIIDDRIKAGKSVSFETRLTRNFLKNTHVDFISGRKWSYTISGILILISIASMCFKGFTYGVDFTGGRTYVVRFDQPVTAEEVREATGNTFNLAAHEQGITSGAAVEVKQFGGESQMKITTAYKVEDESIAVDDELEHMLYASLKGFYLEDLTFEENSPRPSRIPTVSYLPTRSELR